MNSGLSQVLGPSAIGLRVHIARIAALAHHASCVILLVLGWEHCVRYHLMQLFLARRDEGTLFGTTPARQSRQKCIQEIFAREIQFEHFKQPYVFEPFESPQSDKIVGVIGKERSVTVAGPPAEKFAHHEVSNWETANVLIDSSGGGDGQKIAMQTTIGQPIAIFRSLVDHVNNMHVVLEWLVVVNAITTREQFWTAAERYRGHIAEIDLAFEVPNIWDGQSETEKALRELKEKNNAQEVEVKIKNKDGQLIPDSQRIRDSVEYITRGGGKAQLRDETQATIYTSDSEENAVSVPVEPDAAVQDADVRLLQYLIGRLFGSDGTR